jgi:biopolymer transport protein ExbB
MSADPQPVEFSVLSNGGPMLIPLIGLSLIALVFIVERTLFLHRGRIRAAEFLDGVRNNLRHGRLVEALTACEQAPGPVARVVKASLLHTRDGEPRMRAAAEEAALLELPILERRIGTISAIAKLAPLLGMLGTVIALLKTFLTLRSTGHYASADQFSGDIAGALVTTAAGLGISAVAHLGVHFLNGRVRALVHDIEWAAVASIRFVCHELPAEREGRAVEAGEEKA